MENILGAKAEFREGPARYARYCNRAVAFLIDLIALAMIQGIIGITMAILCLLIPAANYSQWLTQTFILTGCLIVIPFLFMPAYFLVFHALGGMTPGKLIMGIRVVSRSHETIRPGISFLRVVGYVLSGLPLAAGFLWVLLDSENKAWHDKLAGTRVVFNWCPSRNGPFVRSQCHSKNEKCSHMSKYAALFHFCCSLTSNKKSRFWTDTN